MLGVPPTKEDGGQLVVEGHGSHFTSPGTFVVSGDLLKFFLQRVHLLAALASRAVEASQTHFVGEPVEDHLVVISVLEFVLDLRADPEIDKEPNLFFAPKLGPLPLGLLSVFCNCRVIWQQGRPACHRNTNADIVVIIIIVKLQKR